MNAKQETGNMNYIFVDIDILILYEISFLLIYVTICL